jgi:hypothetical protein
MIFATPSLVRSTVLSVLGVLAACSSSTPESPGGGGGDPGPTSIDASDLGADCSGGSNPGSARAFVESQCPDQVCLFDSRTDPGSGPLAYCTAKCDRAPCPDGYVCDDITDTSGNSGKYCVMTDRSKPRPGDAGTDATPDAPPRIKRAFTTSELTLGNFGGLAQADALCQSSATAAKLGGTWRAFLAGTTQSPVGPWYLVDRKTRVMQTLPDFGAGLVHAMDMDENGNTIPPGTSAWTGSSTDCAGWTATDRSDVGTAGDATTATAGFFAGRVKICLSEKAALYCLEQ